MSSLRLDCREPNKKKKTPRRVESVIQTEVADEEA